MVFNVTFNNISVISWGPSLNVTDNFTILRCNNYNLISIIYNDSAMTDSVHALFNNLLILVYIGLLTDVYL
jgi:hypothetical protein